MTRLLQGAGSDEQNRVAIDYAAAAGNQDGAIGIPIEGGANIRAAFDDRVAKRVEV
jgi:hypothetical protein